LLCEKLQAKTTLLFFWTKGSLPVRLTGSSQST
jgi:hypothetical protein